MIQMMKMNLLIPVFLLPHLLNQMFSLWNLLYLQVTSFPPVETFIPMFPPHEDDDSTSLYDYSDLTLVNLIPYSVLLLPTPH